MKDLLKLHEEINAQSRNLDDKIFLSGWQTSTPNTKKINTSSLSNKNPNAYQFLLDSEELTSLIQDFHLKNDNHSYEKEDVLISPGSSPLITSLMFYLSVKNYSVYYYPPHILHLLLFRFTTKNAINQSFL